MKRSVWIAITGAALMLGSCTDAFEERGLCSYLGACGESEEDCNSKAGCSDATMTSAILKSRDNSGAGAHDDGQ